MIFPKTSKASDNSFFKSILLISLALAVTDVILMSCCVTENLDLDRCKDLSNLERVEKVAAGALAFGMALLSAAIAHSAIDYSTPFFSCEKISLFSCAHNRQAAITTDNSATYNNPYLAIEMV